MLSCSPSTRSILQIAAMLLGSSLAACSGGDTSGPNRDTDAGGPDAGPPSCEERTPLTIGHCVEADTGNPCVSADSDMQLFVPIEDGTVIHPIIGLQGSPMFVLAVQAQDIAPGDDLDAPMVQLRVNQGDQDVGGFAARPIIVESATTPGLMTAPRLFVVSFFADELLGEELSVIAEVEDRNGSTWCSEDTFEVGQLIDAEPLP